MTPTEERTKFTLTPLEITALKAICSAPTADYAEKFEAVVKIVHGLGLFAATEKLDPTAVALPEAQWGEVCQWLVDLPSTMLGGPNMALSWMNIGPSSFKEGTDG